MGITAKELAEQLGLSPAAVSLAMYTDYEKATNEGDKSHFFTNCERT